MKRFVFVCVLLSIFCAIESQSASWYVRPNGGAYGSANGTDWNNAFNGFSGISWASVACGDTIWVAGGTYTQGLGPAKNCTERAQLYIRRARADAAACTGAAGWSAGFSSLVIQDHTQIGIANNVNWVTISGRATANPADFGEYGWKIDWTGGTACTANIEFGQNANPSSNITFEYLDLQGTYAGGSHTGNCRAVDDTNLTSTSTNHTYSHMRIQGHETALMVVDSNNHVSEYLDISSIAGSRAIHPNLHWIQRSNGGIIRYSKIHESGASGTGSVWVDGTANNWWVYGNIFYKHPIVAGGSNTALSIDGGPTVLHLLNNTFYNNASNLYIHNGGSCGPGSESKNNLIFGEGGGVSCGTTSNNISISSSPNPFINPSTDDYHIIGNAGGSYPRNAGTALTTDRFLSYDANGVRRGSDGAWDVGAYEYTSDSSNIVAPKPPVSLRAK